MSKLNLEQLKKRAKELVRDHAAGSPAAIAFIRAHHPHELAEPPPHAEAVPERSRGTLATATLFTGAVLRPRPMPTTVSATAMSG